MMTFSGAFAETASRFLSGSFSRTKSFAAAGFCLPGTDRVKRRSAERLAGAKTETGVMPWASDGIAGYEALGQWTAIVGTGRADGEVSIAAPSDQDSLAVGVALHHAAIDELRDVDSLSKIWPAQFLFFDHWFAEFLF